MATDSGGLARTLLTSEHTAIVLIRELVSSVAAVVVVGLVLFAISGVWPPMVAVESGSMEPVMERGDLVFIVEADRFADSEAATHGVVTSRAGAEIGQRSFGANGDVIVFDPPDRRGAPIIHRAMFWVEEDENWVTDANQSYLSDQQCETDDDPQTDTGVRNCPAPHAGFVTKGDANPTYDQARGLAPPVRSEWVTGTAEVRVPGIGLIRLIWSGR
jgi:signal peptidase